MLMVATTTHQLQPPPPLPHFALKSCQLCIHTLWADFEGRKYEGINLIIDLAQKRWKYRKDDAGLQNFLHRVFAQCLKKKIMIK